MPISSIAPSRLGRSKTEDQNRIFETLRQYRHRREQSAYLPSPLWEKVSPKATDEGCSRERRRLTPLEHPSSVSALRADPPSPTRGEGGTSATSPWNSCRPP
ncbi:MAG: hypothetical protein E5Y01_33325 [Mesorhizobium sp.]|nr:MAG: hypothetical protein E5Y01_33325 [Mesorhizobium sp.]